jgi:hypothetical protein
MQSSSFMATDLTNFAPADGHIGRIRFSNTARYTEASYPVAPSLSADANTLLLVRFDRIESDLVRCDTGAIMAAGNVYLPVVRNVDFLAANAAGIGALGEVRFQGLNFFAQHHPGTAGIFRQCCLMHSDVDRISVLYSLYAVYDRNNCYTDKIEHVTGTLSPLSRYGVGSCLAANDLQINHSELRGAAHQIAVAAGASIRIDTAYLINPVVTSLCSQNSGVSVSNLHASSENNPTNILAAVVGQGDTYQGIAFSDCELDAATGFGAPAVILDGGAAAHFDRCYFGTDSKAPAEIEVKQRPYHGITISTCTQLDTDDTYPQEAGHRAAKPFADAMDIVTVIDADGVSVGGARVVGHQQDHLGDLPPHATPDEIVKKVNAVLAAVRAAGPIAPTQFRPDQIDDLVADFTDDPASVRVDTDGKLTWTSQTTALKAEAPAPQNQPTYSATAGPAGSPLLVGNPATLLRCPSNIVPTGSARTVIALARPDTPAAGVLLTCKVDGVRCRFGLSPTPAPTVPTYWTDGAGRAAVTDGPAIAAGAWHVFVYTFDTNHPAPPLLRINGRYLVDRPQVTPVADTGSDGFALLGDPAEAGQGWTGALKRMIVYSRVLTLTEIQTCERALMRQLGIRDVRH